jgi:predicted dehydrogenase
VVITTPHTLHYDQLTAAVDAGIHVLCEKPLVTGVENAVSVVELDREVDTVIMPGYQRHLQPAYVAARGWWRTNADAPTGLASSITQDWIDGQAGTWRVDPDLSGGGFLYDTGSHVLDALLWITGLRPAAVSAEMTFTDDDERVDSAASLLIDFETDVSATVTLAGDVHEVYEHHQFWTDGAGLRIEGEGWAPRKLETFTSDWRSQPRGGGDPSNKVEAFVDAVLDGTEPPATTFDALQTTAVTEAAYEAARTGDRVPIEVDLDAYAPE